MARRNFMAGRLCCVAVEGLELFLSLLTGPFFFFLCNYNLMPGQPIPPLYISGYFPVCDPEGGCEVLHRRDWVPARPTGRGHSQPLRGPGEGGGEPLLVGQLLDVERDVAPGVGPQHLRHVLVHQPQHVLFRLRSALWSWCVVCCVSPWCVSCRVVSVRGARRWSRVTHLGDGGEDLVFAGLAVGDVGAQEGAGVVVRRAVGGDGQHGLQVDELARRVKVLQHVASAPDQQQPTIMNDVCVCALGRVVVR